MKIYSFKSSLLLGFISIVLFISSFIIFLFFMKSFDYDLVCLICGLFSLSLIIALIFINRDYDIYFGEEIISNVSFNGVDKFVINPKEICSVNIINKEQLSKIYKKRIIGKKYILITLIYDKKVVIPCFWFSDKQIKFIVSEINVMVEKYEC